MARADKLPDFEHSLTELEQLVERLEHGDLPLDEALKTFERGVALTRSCQNALKSAQQKVEILLRRGGEVRHAPFAAGEDEPGTEADIEAAGEADAEAVVTAPAAPGR